MSAPAMKRLLLAFALLAGTVGPLVTGAELAARGLSFPFFDDTGKLTHKVTARHGTMTGAVRRLGEVEIEYYENGDPARVIQRVKAAAATWNETTEILEGPGAIAVETDENRLTGEGFRFELRRSQLHIHRDFAMTNREVLLTSDRAVVDLVLERSDEAVKLRDVKRCEAFGNLRVKVLPTATRKYTYDQADSERAIYDGVLHTIFIPQRADVLKNGRVSTVNDGIEYRLDEKSRPAVKLKKD